MIKFLVTVAIEIPATEGIEASEKLSEFLSSITTGGKPLKFWIQDININKPDLDKPAEE